MIRFTLLGPIGAVRDGAPVSLGGPKQRAVLAMLLLNANKVVSVSQMVNGIWAERAPDRAVNAVQVYVSGLRRALEPRPHIDPATALVTTRGHGYQVRADERSLDLLDFLASATEGRRLLEQRRYAEAGDRFRHALGLWQGPALADVADEPFAQAEGTAIEESRTATLEARIEVDLVLGRQAEVVGELRSLVAAQPLRERFRGLLAEALYRSGRQSEALAIFRDTRRVLADELGLDPSPELQALEHTILTHAKLHDIQRGGRPFILFQDGGGHQQIVALDASSSPLTIGRRSANHICLGWDADVSRLHARLEHTEGAWDLVDDCLSRNGSFVDGERVQGRVRLHDAQVIRVGATVLLFRTAGATNIRQVRGSGITSDAPIRTASELSPADHTLLSALAADQLDPRDAQTIERMAALRRRFAVSTLPLNEQDEALLQRARAIGALPSRQVRPGKLAD